jgi:hypothetical protein
MKIAFGEKCIRWKIIRRKLHSVKNDSVKYAFGEMWFGETYVNPPEVLGSTPGIVLNWREMLRSTVNFTFIRWNFDYRIASALQNRRISHEKLNSIRLLRQALLLLTYLTLQPVCSWVLSITLHPQLGASNLGSTGPAITVHLIRPPGFRSSLPLCCLRSCYKKSLLWYVFGSSNHVISVAHSVRFHDAFGSNTIQYNFFDSVRLSFQRQKRFADCKETKYWIFWTKYWKYLLAHASNTLCTITSLHCHISQQVSPSIWVYPIGNLLIHINMFSKPISVYNVRMS